MIDAAQAPGELAGEQVIFDANVEAQGHEFFALGGMDISKDGRWMHYSANRETAAVLSDWISG